MRETFFARFILFARLWLSFALFFYVQVAAAPLRFPVDIEADNEHIKSLLQSHLSLIKRQLDSDVDAAQMAFLAEDAPQEIETILNTEGYFSGRATVEKTGGQAWRVMVHVGPRAYVEETNVSIVGDIFAEDDVAEYYKNAMENWALPIGSAFTQDHWSASKNAVLSSVVRHKFPLAKIVESRAEVNPKTHRAALFLSVDSGRPVYFGKVNIAGNERYPATLARGLAHFRAGAPYDLGQLLDYQQALEQDSHYAGASVRANFDALTGDVVPVNVEVRELQKHKFELGAHFDSSDGLGGEAGWEYYNLFNKGYTAATSFSTDRYDNTLSAGISQPRQSNGYYWTANIRRHRLATQKLVTTATNSGFWYVRDRNGIDARFGLEYLSDESRISGGSSLGQQDVLMLTASFKSQRIQSVLRPYNGYYVEGKIGSTVGRLLSSAPLQRVLLGAGYYFTPEERQYGTWVARVRAGLVRTKNPTPPQSLLFRTGGASGVRGYERDGIGLIGEQNAILPGKAMLAGSLEYQFPIARRFSLAFFHDAGVVGNGLKLDKGIKWHQGSGLGVRWFSPLAPFAFDLAYGHTDKKWRWHISLGTRF